MTAPIKIDELQHRFGARPPEIDGVLCLNQHHRQAGCTRCQDICPTQAIDLDSGIPIVLDNRCIHCAGCVTVCPTDAFGPQQRAERLLLRTAEQLPSTPLALVCGIHPDPDATTLPVARILRHGRCLISLSASHLLSLAADGDRTLWLDDSPCSACVIGSVHGHLVHIVAQANQLLAVAGLPRSICMAASVPEPALSQPVAHPLIQGQQPTISRRGLFSSLGKALQGGDRASQSKDPMPSTPIEEDDTHLPASRLALLAWLQHHPPADEPGSDKALLSTTELPFVTVHVDKLACSGCGLCARLCPTDALRFDGNMVRLSSPSEPFSLNFRPGWCVNCGICQVICPEKVVEIGPCPSPEIFAADTPLQLVAGNLVPCTECQSPTAHHTADGRPICHVCRSLPSTDWSDDPFA